ncbi:hypothetical protein [Brevundimonas sp. DC300-4]|uniref:hypothetical protein n=1 Tax=Brevundimonas sp. DC300-4 TaxID=2804594 RepID=UPI003CEDF2D4
MSYVKLENRPVSWWRCRAATIGQMIDQGWVVWSVCNACFLVMPADLDWFAFRLGDEETLWNRHPSCRRLGCKGTITFHGTPPTINRCMELRAEWPPEWAETTPTVPPRLPPEQREQPLPDPAQPEASRRFRP